MSSRIERRCRRLLWAYPRSYRDHRGTEILTTLLEMAEDGHRPGLHLVLSGLRQRFRLPARRPLAWLAALLAAAVLGGFGATAGTWLAWRTAAALPSDRELQALNATLSGIPADAPLYHDTSAQQGPGVAILADGTTDWSADRIRDTLTGAGWRITAVQRSDVHTPPREGTDTSIPTTFGTWTATRGGLKMHGNARVVTGAAAYTVNVWPDAPTALRPLTIAGAVAGLLAGWLLVAALARRRLPTALAAAGLAAAAPPAYRFYRETYQVMIYTHGSPYPPSTVDGSHGGMLTLICTAAGLLTIAAAVAVARRRPAVRTG